MPPSFDWLHGFVLHRRDYRETSAIVDFFCLEHGRVAGIARGIRTAKSTKKAYLQPFQPLQFTLSGRGELKNIGKLEASENALDLKGQAMFCGLYLNEIINRIMPKDMPAIELFQAYVLALKHLSEQHEQEIVLRQFEFALLQELGQSPEWQFDSVSGQRILPQQYYVFNPEIGFAQHIATFSNPVSVSVSGSHTATATVQTFSGQALLDVASDVWSVPAKAAAKAVNRRLLQPLLGNRPLKSRDLFVQRRKWSEQIRIICYTSGLIFHSG